MSVWLAFVLYAKLTTTAPKIVEVYRSLEDCQIEARKRNRATKDDPSLYGAAFVCLRIVSDA